MATGLMIAGGLVWAGSFTFSVINAINTIRYKNRIFSDEMNEESRILRRMFNLQLGALIGVILGGGAFFIGLNMLTV